MRYPTTAPTEIGFEPVISFGGGDLFMTVRDYPDRACIRIECLPFGPLAQNILALVLRALLIGEALAVHSATSAAGSGHPPRGVKKSLGSTKEFVTLRIRSKTAARGRRWPVTYSRIASGETPTAVAKSRGLTPWVLRYSPSFIASIIQRSVGQVNNRMLRAFCVSRVTIDTWENCDRTKTCPLLVALLLSV